MAKRRWWFKGGAEDAALTGLPRPRNHGESSDEPKFRKRLKFMTGFHLFYLTFAFIFKLHEVQNKMQLSEE